MATICTWTLNELIDELDKLKIKGSQYTTNMSFASTIDISYYFAKSGAQVTLFRTVNMHPDAKYRISADNIKLWKESDLDPGIWTLCYDTAVEILDEYSVTNTAQNIKNYCDEITALLEKIFKDATEVLPEVLEAFGFKVTPDGYSKFIGTSTVYTLELDNNTTIKIRIPLAYEGTRGDGMINSNFDLFIYQANNNNPGLLQEFKSFKDLEQYLLSEE